MAKSTKNTAKSGDFLVIVNAKTGHKKACSASDYEQFQENSPEAGDWTVKSEHSTSDEAEAALID